MPVKTPKPRPQIPTIDIRNLQTEILRTLYQFDPIVVKPLKKMLGQLLQAAETTTQARLAKVEETFLKRCLTEIEKQLIDHPFEVYPPENTNEINQSYLTKITGHLRAAFAREALRRSLTRDEKIEILRGMLLTRHLDARLKKFFLTSEIKLPSGAPVQGKGFRSTGQEAIYAGAIRLRRFPPTPAAAENGNSQTADYTGDFVAPMIRDLGLALAMGVQPYDVMAAKFGKTGKPTNGKDLHYGDLSCGVLPPAAPLAVSAGLATGMGLALTGSGRVVINCNGEGATSSGEWHEAINFAAVRKLPVVFVVQNNQTALSTPTDEQFACDRLADKAPGYGILGSTVDGTDPEAVFAAITAGAEACRRGEGPVLVELISMRMCGHAHHDDMLYFGHEPDQFLTYPELKDAGYADKAKYEYWRKKDPIATYRKKLLDEGVLTESAYEKLVDGVAKEIAAAASRLITAPWPDPENVSDPVFTDGPRIKFVEPLQRHGGWPEIQNWTSPEPVGFQPDPKGKTFWQAIAEALHEEMTRDQEVFILGEDVGGKYGNAFVILRDLLADFSARIINTPISEAAIIGAATGAALLGKRPVAEIQFNDFVASGFNPLVNSTAKIFARWYHSVPLTIRLPWGGLRFAGPFHSQNTEPWFYRTPGLKIVCPSTPREAKALLKAAIRDDNPVLYYEHIALYRAADIKEHLDDPDWVLPIGTAHLKRDGSDLTMITYGAYVHRCLKAAETLEREHHLSCKVLDLRSLQPLDKTAILACVKDTSRVLIVQEDSKTGGIGQSVASIIAEEAFEYLDAPVRVLGALDRPVPYSPTLEPSFLVSQEKIITAAKLLCDY